MFGRRKRHGEVAVDAALELDLSSVEASIAAYLHDQSDSRRDQLVQVLETLDEQIDQSDAYESSVIGSAALGFSAKGSVIGETSAASATEEISHDELQPQTVLIRAAKQEVTRPTADNLAALLAASEALAALRSANPPAR
jgi:hypothetical protein